MFSYWSSSSGAGGGERPEGGARVPPLPGAQAAGRPGAHHGRPICPAAPRPFGAEPRPLGAQRGRGEQNTSLHSIHRSHSYP